MPKVWFDTVLDDVKLLPLGAFLCQIHPNSKACQFLPDQLALSNVLHARLTPAEARLSSESAFSCCSLCRVFSDSSDCSAMPVGLLAELGSFVPG